MSISVKTICDGSLVRIALGFNAGCNPESRRGAFGELYLRHFRKVRAICFRRCGSADLADDYAQDVFIVALEKLVQLRDPERFGSWVCTLASRYALNRVIRRAPEYPVSDAQAGALQSRDSSPDTAAELREERAAVLAALHQLPDPDGAILAARYYCGSPVRQIADDLSVPLGTAKRRLSTARRRLRAALVA